jgi:hypothetical protein
MNHPHPMKILSPSAGNDQDEDDLPAATALADILEDPNTKWSDIRAALEAAGWGSYVNMGGKKTVGATTNAGMLSALMVPRRGRMRGGGGPSEDDEWTTSTHRKENHNGRGGEDDIKSPGEEEDTNSSFEACLVASIPDLKARRTPRRLSARSGASFKSKLKFVIEDVEADLNGKLIKRLSGDANDDSNHNSMSDFSASVNMMDFGVSSRRNSLFSLDASESSVDSITSSCVDSDGFLPWRRHGSRDDASSSSSLYTHLPRGSNSDGALNKSSLSSNRSDASLSNLVDSSGFLGWGESVRHSGFAGEEKGCGKRDDDVADGPFQGDSGETWRIEDYEGNNDYVKRPGPGRMSFANVRLTFGPAAKPRRPTVSAPGDDSIKNILLKGCRPTANKPMLSSAGNRAREYTGASVGAFDASTGQKPAIRSLFGISGKASRGPSSSSEHEDKYYSRPSIHLNREDGVDIGELRRELELAMKESRRSTM